MIGNGGLADNIEIKEAIGSSISGRAITDVLFVSPNGDNSNGSSWSRAYQTIQSALDAASTDADDCTLILIAPHATFYDINTTGDPTWSANVILMATHRLWAPIRNDHVGATSIMKFTGKASLMGLGIFQTGTTNGVIFTNGGFRIRRCGFNSESITAPATSIDIDGSAAFIRGGIMEDIQLRGHVSHTKGIRLNNAKINESDHLHIHECLTGLQIEHVDSDSNSFHDIEIGGCALGIDIDGGNGQHFDNITFHNNTRNVDDEVGDHVWDNIKGQFPISIYPDDFTGITVSSDAVANTWGALTEIIAANAIDNPFRVVGVVFDPTDSQWSRVRFTGDAGSIYYDDIMFDASRQAGSNAPSGTEFIFNADTKIEAAAKVISAGPDDIKVWLAIQEI